jgi:hypothetical protein
MKPIWTTMIHFFRFLAGYEKYVHELEVDI